MPIRRRPDKGPGVFEVRLQVAKGKTRGWIVRGTSAEAKAFEAAKKVEVGSGKLAPAAPRVAPPFLSFCAEVYTPHAKLYLRAATWAVRKYQIATLCERLGTIKLTEIDTTAVEDFAKARLAAGIQPTTINGELRRLGTILRYARAKGYPCASPEIRELPVVGRRRVRWWTVEQIGQLYRAVERLDPPLLPLVVGLINTGMRPGEGIALERAAVDLERRIITIEPSEVWQPKDNEPREIPISDALFPFLARAIDDGAKYVFGRKGGARRWKRWPKNRFNRCRRAAGHADDCALWVKKKPAPPASDMTERVLDIIRARPAASAAVIAAELGANVDAVKSLLRRMMLTGKVRVVGSRKGAKREIVDDVGPKTTGCTCGAKGLKGGPYTIRHTFASHFLRACPDLFLLAKVMGHDHTKVTALYAHLLPEHLAAARNAVNLAPSTTA